MCLVAAHEGVADGGGKACEGEADLGADRNARVADLGVEHLGVERRPDGIRGSVEDGHQSDCGEEDQGNVAAGDCAEVHVDEHRATEGATDEQRPAADPVGEHRPGGLTEQGYGVGCDGNPEHGRLRNPHFFGGGESETEDGEDGRDDGDESAADHANQICAVGAKKIGNRQFGDGLGFLLLGELFGLFELETHDVCRHENDQAAPERDSPAPRVEDVVGERGDGQEYEAGEDEAGLGAVEGPTAEERASAFGGVFERQ